MTMTHEALRTIERRRAALETEAHRNPHNTKEFSRAHAEFYRHLRTDFDTLLVEASRLLSEQASAEVAASLGAQDTEKAYATWNERDVLKAKPAELEADANTALSEICSVACGWAWDLGVRSDIPAWFESALLSAQRDDAVAARDALKAKLADVERTP